MARTYHLGDAERGGHLVDVWCADGSEAHYRWHGVSCRELAEGFVEKRIQDYIAAAHNSIYAVGNIKTTPPCGGADCPVREPGGRHSPLGFKA